VAEWSADGGGGPVGENPREGVKALSEGEAKRMLAGVGVPVVEGREVTTLAEAERVAEALSYPVVLKACSPDVLHKTEAGLVQHSIGSREALAAAWELTKRRATQVAAERGARFQGFLVERHLAGPREFLAGVVRDPQFGPVVAFGVGGVLAEALCDVAFGIAPLSDGEADELIDAIRARALLGEFRGGPAVDRKVLRGILQALGDLALREASILEIDINPLLLDGGRPVAADALVTLRDETVSALVPPEVSGEADADDPPLVNTANLRYLFHPDSVALIGASNDPTKWGGLILTSLLSGGFAGRIYPVNPRADMMFGLPAYPGIEELPEIPDLVLAAVRAELVQGLVEQCGRAGVKALVIISAGFEEIGEEGAAAARAAAETASRHGLVMVGPNSLGVMCAERRLYATGASVLQPKPGPAGFASQSGSMGVQLLSAAERHHAGAGKYVGVGNEAQVDVGRFVDYFRSDPDTGVVLAYIEGVRDGRRLLHSLRECTAEKPVVLLRGGASEYGRRAAASHTGALAGSQEVFEALVRQSGVSYTTNPSEFLDLTYCYSYLPLPKGPRIAVVSVGGGWGVLAADEVSRQGLRLSRLEPAVMERLNALLPPFWSHGNPVDLAGMFTERREPEESVYAVVPSDEVDAVVVIGVLGIVAQPERTVEAITRMKLRQGRDTAGVEMPDTNVYMEREIVFLQQVCRLMEEYGKPIINVPFAPTPKYVYDMNEKYSAVLLPTPIRAVRCLAHMARYSARRSRG